MSKVKDIRSLGRVDLEPSQPDFAALARKHSGRCLMEQKSNFTLSRAKWAFLYGRGCSDHWELSTACETRSSRGPRASPAPSRSWFWCGAAKAALLAQVLWICLTQNSSFFPGPQSFIRRENEKSWFLLSPEELCWIFTRGRFGWRTEKHLFPSILSSSGAVPFQFLNCLKS